MLAGMPTAAAPRIVGDDGLPAPPPPPPKTPVVRERQQFLSLDNLISPTNSSSISMSLPAYTQQQPMVCTQQQPMVYMQPAMQQPMQPAQPVMQAIEVQPVMQAGTAPPPPMCAPPMYSAPLSNAVGTVQTVPSNVFYDACGNSQAYGFAPPPAHSAVYATPSGCAGAASGCYGMVGYAGAPILADQNLVPISVPAGVPFSWPQAQ